MCGGQWINWGGDAETQGRKQSSSSICQKAYLKKDPSDHDQRNHISY